MLRQLPFWHFMHGPHEVPLLLLMMPPLPLHCLHAPADVPAGFGGLVQLPLPVLQLSNVQNLPSEQFFGVPARQLPLLQ